MMTEHWKTPDQIAQANLIIDCYERLLKRPLVQGDDAETRARNLWQASFCVLSHGTQKDPLFNYANRLALSVWEMSWNELIGMPSRYSAEPVHRDERERFLKRVAEQGYVDDYRGVRVSKTGRRFAVNDVTVFNLEDEDGVPRGQAAVCSSWDFL